tara:strand:- start:388 stop:648 length:261 start_codon:yes stop_codon:yes gene_type:complete
MSEDESVFKINSKGSVMLNKSEEEAAIQLFQEVCKFRTVSGLGVENNSYNDIAQFLMREMQAAGISSFELKESVPNKPVIVGKFSH